MTIVLQGRREPLLVGFIEKHPIFVLISLFALLYLLSPIKAQRDNKDTTPARIQETRPRYEGSWRSDFDRGISVALAKNGVRDCGQYAYKRSSGGSEEYLVRCTSDRAHRKKESGELTNILFYQVWPNINSVVGPFHTEDGAG